MDQNQDSSTRVEGEYSVVPNPCTTVPCLPGMVYAVSTADACYVLSRAGHWLAESCRWGDFMPELGDQIVVSGHVTRKSDLRGDMFLEIEVESLTRKD